MTLCWALKKSWSEKERRIQQQGVEQLSQIPFKTATGELTKSTSTCLCQVHQSLLAVWRSKQDLEGACMLGNKWKSHSRQSFRLYWFGRKKPIIYLSSCYVVLIKFTSANALDVSEYMVWSQSSKSLQRSAECFEALKEKRRHGAFKPLGQRLIAPQDSTRTVRWWMAWQTFDKESGCTLILKRHESSDC